MTPAGRAVLALTAVNVLWGSTFVYGKDAIGACGSWEGYLGLRFAIGAAATALCFPGSLKRLSSGALWRDALLLAMPTSAGFGLQAAGLVRVTPSESAFLTSLYVPFTPLAGWLLFHARTPRAILPALALALGGMWLISPPTSPCFGAGEVLSAACGAAFALQIILTDRLAPRHDAAALALATLAILAAAFLAVGGLPAAPPLGTMLYLGGLATVIPFWAMNRFQATLPPAHAAVIYAAEPIFASVFSWAKGRETLGPVQLAGAALVVSANALAMATRSRIASSIDPARGHR